MKAGCKIRVFFYYGTEDFTVEEFRYCLGIFQSEAHRTAGCFTALCELYEAGPKSEQKYISNFGSYDTEQVQAWADIPIP